MLINKDLIKKRVSEEDVKPPLRQEGQRSREQQSSFNCVCSDQDRPLRLFRKTRCSGNQTFKQSLMVTI